MSSTSCKPLPLDLHRLGHLRPRLALAQRRLGLLALGDVQREPNDAGEVALGVPARHLARLHPPLAGRGAHRFDDVGLGLARGQHLLVVPPVGLRLFPGIEIKERPALQLFLGRSHAVGKGAVHPQEVVLPVLVEDQGRRRIQNELQFLALPGERLLGLRMFDQVRCLPRQQVNPPEVVLVGGMRNPPLGGKDAHQLAGTADQWRGLHRAHAGLAQHGQRRGPGKQRTRLHVRDHHALAALERFPAHRCPVLRSGKELQEWRLMAVMGHDPQQLAFQQLQRPPLGPRNSYRCVHNFLQQGFRSRRSHQLPAERLHPGQGSEVGAQARLGLLALDGLRPELAGALADHVFQMLAVPGQFDFGLPPLGDVRVHLQDHRRAVHVGERVVMHVNHAAVRPFDLPMVGATGLEHVVGFAEVARLGAPEAVFVTAPAIGLAELRAEGAVGKGDVVIRPQQANHRRQRFQHVQEPLPFRVNGLP